jgi:hypothetical protein
MTVEVEELNRKVRDLRAGLDPLYSAIERVIVGQRTMLDRLVVGLLTGGHILLEGVPGLAKTLAVRTLARGLRLSFSRIQFTPDLLPADVIGTQIYNPRSGEFSIKKGPVFANLVLADEINRAPAKVQSALLEAMQEKQVTIGDNSYLLEAPFLVLATQNPIEQEGTYPLPEAQVDRFMLKLKLTYPSKEDELIILNRMAAIEPKLIIDPVLGPADLFALRDALDETLHRRSRPRHAQTGGLRFGHRLVHPVRCQSARHDFPGSRRQGDGVSRWPRIRHAAGREDDWPRCLASSRQRHLRSRGRGRDLRSAVATHLRYAESAVIARISHRRERRGKSRKSLRQGCAERYGYE